MNSRILTNKNTFEKSSFVFVNNTADSVKGNRYSFSYDISKSNFDCTKPHKVNLKSAYYLNSIFQISSKYGYNILNCDFINATSQAVILSLQINLSEGIYDTTELCSAIQSQINATVNLYNTISKDLYTVSYNTNLNKINIARNTSTNVPSQTYKSQLILKSNTTNEFQNGTYGYGLAFIIGLDENTTLATAIAVSNTNLPQSVNLLPYSYIYLQMGGLTSNNLSSDITGSNVNIVARLPLTSKRYEYVFFEEHPELSGMYFGSLPSILTFDIVDQYGQPLSNTPLNWEIDLQFRIEPL